MKIILFGLWICGNAWENSDVKWLANVRWSVQAGVFVTNLGLHIARFGELTIAGQGK